MKAFAEKYLRIMTSLYVAAVFCLLPLYFTKGYEQIGMDKVELYRGISKVVLAAVLPIFVLIVLRELYTGIKQRGYLKQRFSALDFWVISYGISVGCSYLFSDYKESVLWGYEDWGLGAVPLFVMVLSYFLVSRYLTAGKMEKVVYILTAAVTFVVFVLGVLNRFMIDPLGIQGSLYELQIPYWIKGNFLSTIGNINWFSAYLSSLVFSAVGAFLYTECELKWKLWILAGFCGIGLWILVLQGSNTGHLTLLCMGIIAMAQGDGVSAPKWQQNWKKSTMLFVLLFSALCLTHIFILLGGKFNYSDSILRILVNSPFPWCGLLLGFALYKWNNSTTVGKATGKVIVYVAAAAMVIYLIFGTVKTIFPDRLLFLPSNWFVWDYHWGNNRGVNIWAGFACFDAQDLLHKLFGVGPDGMVQYMYSSLNTAIRDKVMQVQGTQILTNAHCEPLTMLVNQGLFGCVCFVGILLQAVKTFLQKENGMEKAVAFGVIAYGIHGIFGFSTVLSTSMLFVFLGVMKKAQQP